MIAWSTVAPGLRELFSSMAIDTCASPEFLAQWAEGKKEFTHPEVGMDLTLKITSVANEGLDELRYEQVDDRLNEYVVGHRRFTLQCRVDSHFHDEDDERCLGWSWNMAERLRTNIRRTRNRQALEALNVSLIDIGSAVDSSLSFDKRRINSAVIDFFFYTAVCDVDPIPLGWIETVRITSLVQDTGGTTLPDPPNYTDVLIPS